MIIIPIEVFRKYLYNFGVWIEYSTQVFYSYKPKSLNSIVVWTQDHIGRSFHLDITLITTVYLHSKYEDSTKCSHCSEEQTVFHWWKSHSCDMCDYLCRDPRKIIARSHIKYTIVPSACVLRVLVTFESFLRCLGKERWHGGEGERKMIDTFSMCLTLQTHLWTHLSTFFSPF